LATQLFDQFQRAGHRLTRPRWAVLQVLQSHGEHLSLAEVLARGRKLYPGLSRATVYRTLELLTELGLIRPIYLGERGSRVVCVEGGHHHMVCLECGAAIHFDDCLIQDYEQTLGERTGFQIRGHLLEFYGVCRQCRQRSAVDCRESGAEANRA